MPRGPVAQPLGALALLTPFAVFLVVYGFTAGHGFALDDYQWISASVVGSVADFIHLFRVDNGFYRPMVALTFAADHWLFGLDPLGYGFTNIALALGCGAAIGRLARVLGLPRGAAVFAAALWLLNYKGIGMAVLWISGRTSLVATLFAVLGAAEWLRGRAWSAGPLVFAALLAKEEAVLVPFVLLMWWYLLHRRPTGVEKNRPPGSISCWGEADRLAADRALRRGGLLLVAVIDERDGPPFGALVLHVHARSARHPQKTSGIRRPHGHDVGCRVRTDVRNDLGCRFAKTTTRFVFAKRHPRSFCLDRRYACPDGPVARALRYLCAAAGGRRLHRSGVRLYAHVGDGG